MSITDELREYAEENECKSYCKLLTAIADRIDEEHEDQLFSARNAAYNKGYDEGFASADDWCADNADDLREHGWVRLPFGTDGVPWRIGDRTESGQTIKTMVLSEHGWYFCGTVNEIDPTMHRHYQEPTVKDVLFEFAQFWSDEELTDIEHLQPDAAQTIADYAAKLQLRED